MVSNISRRRYLAVLASAASLARTWPAYSQPMPTITFGGTIPFSGRWAEVGQSVNAGYQTVAKYVNEVVGGWEIGGRKYRLDIQLVDDASDPQRATTLLQKQIDDGTQFFLGSYSSGIVLPQAAIINRARRLMVQAGGGADAIFTQGYRYIFGMYPRASRSAFPAVFAFAALTPKPKTFTVVYSNDPFSKPQGEGVIAKLKEMNLEILDTFEVPPQVQDVSAVLGAIREKTPDVLMCVTADQTSLLIARQMAQAKIDVKMLFTSLGPQTASFRDALGKYADGITCISTWSPTFPYKDPIFGSTARFADYYKANNTVPLIYHQGTAAACIVAYCWALQKVGRIDDLNAVRDAVAAIDIESLYGPIKFTPDGDGDPVAMGVSVQQVQGGQVKVTYPPSLIEAPMQWPIQPFSAR